MSHKQNSIVSTCCQMSLGAHFEVGYQEVNKSCGPIFRIIMGLAV